MPDASPLHQERYSVVANHNHVVDSTDICTWKSLAGTDVQIKEGNVGCAHVVQKRCTNTFVQQLLGFSALTLPIRL